jgi:cytochrome c biogenesis protein CcdA
MLYVAHASLVSVHASHRRKAIAVILGVLAALVVLLVLFQFLHLETLITFVGSATNAIILNTTANLLVGAACIYGGLYYRRTPARTKDRHTTRRHAWGAIGLGLTKTLLSLSGITATFMAGNIISNVSHGFLGHLVLSTLFLVTAIIPFLMLGHLVRRYPKRIQLLIDTADKIVSTQTYRNSISALMICIGCGIVLFGVAGLF